VLGTEALEIEPDTTTPGADAAQTANAPYLSRVIRKPTVLILGAGASKPYGYALGKDLVAQILTRTKPEHGELWPVITNDAYPAELVNEFRDSLKASKPASVDDFLEANPEFRELGRVCISAALTVFGPAEDELKIPNADWLEYVWWRLHNDAPSPRKFAENRLKVITYNYDTSFERYFASVLSFYPELRKDPAKAREFRTTVLPTVHIHGSLGPSIDELRSLRDPMARNQITWYKHAASGIRILSEGEHTVEYSQAKEWIREADVIYFLGFGYHQTNTTRLELRAQMTATVPAHPDRIVKGTALGLGEDERNDVVRRLNVAAEDVHRAGGLLYQLDARVFLEMHGLA